MDSSNEQSGECGNKDSDGVSIYFPDTYKPLNISLDYDDTFTSHPFFWKLFIAMAAAIGHRVFIVSCRAVTAENFSDIEAATGLPKPRIVLTEYMSKRRVCEARGLKIDIWIDDTPDSVENGR